MQNAGHVAEALREAREILGNYSPPPVRIRWLM